MRKWLVHSKINERSNVLTDWWSYSGRCLKWLYLPNEDGVLFILHARVAMMDRLCPEAGWPTCLCVDRDVETWSVIYVGLGVPNCPNKLSICRVCVRCMIQDTEQWSSRGSPVVQAQTTHQVAVGLYFEPWSPPNSSIQLTNVGIFGNYKEHATTWYVETMFRSTNQASLNSPFLHSESRLSVSF